MMETTTDEDVKLSPYQVLIKQIQNDLTLDEMRQVLSDLQIQLNPTLSLESSSFVDILQSRGILREDGSKQLYDSLKRCNLDKVACHFKTYEDQIHEEPSAKRPKKETDPPLVGRHDVNLCPDHPQYTVELFCNTCNKMICFQCVFLSHKDKETHNVLSKKDIEGQIDTTTKELQQRIHNLQIRMESVRTNIEKFEKKETAANFNLIQAQADVWANLLKRHEKDMLNALADKRKHMEQKVNEMKQIMQESEMSIIQIRDTISKASGDVEKLLQLKQLCRWRQKLEELKANVQKAYQEKENVQLLFRPLSKLGAFAEVRIGNVVGAVALSKKYALVVKDQRMTGLKITMSCVSYNTQRTSWERDVEDFSCEKPVIMPAHILSTGVQLMFLMGLGRTLTSVYIERFVEECSISKVISLTIENIAEGDYITAITTVTSGNRDIGMLIAVNASTTLLRFSPLLKYERDIDCSSAVHSIYSVACEDNDIGIIDSVCHEIVLLKVSGDDVMMWGRLNVTNNLSQIPKMIQWDGNFWIVLFISKEGMGEKIEWETVNYLKDSNKFSSSGNGKCNHKTTAVSISFIRDRTVVCFSDGAVTIFPTVVR